MRVEESIVEDTYVELHAIDVTITSHMQDALKQI